MRLSEQVRIVTAMVTKALSSGPNPTKPNPCSSGASPSQSASLSKDSEAQASEFPSCGCHLPGSGLCLRLRGSKRLMIKIQAQMSQDEISGLQKGPAERGHVKNRQKVSKSFSTLFDTFRAGQKTSKIVKKCQKVFRHFSTIFARHLFPGPLLQSADETKP